MRSLAFLLVVSIALLTGCAQKATFKVGDYIMPRDSRSPDAVMKVVAVDKHSYRVFTHFLANGRLIQAEDYLDVERAKTEQMYMLVAPPKVDGSFSPDKYLSKP